MSASRTVPRDRTERTEIKPVPARARPDHDVEVRSSAVKYSIGFSTEKPPNLLTNPKLDPFGKIPEFKFCAAKVERVEPVREAAE